MLNMSCFEGRITNKPQMSGNGLFFTLAVKRNYKDKNTGEVGTDFLPMVCYRRPESLMEYLDVGALISVQAAATSYRKDDREQIIFKVNELHFIQLKAKKGDSSGAVPDLPDEWTNSEDE